MLNLNYNINNTLRNQRNFLKGKVDYRWRRTITTAAGIQSGSIIYGTGSIDFVPFDVETLFLSGTYAVGELSSGSAVGQPVDIKITGSGEWPTTGSNSMYILIGSSLGFNQNEILSMSAQAGNMNLSGSVISSSFLPVLNNEYNIDFGLNHTKGNIYNPLVLWKTMQEEDLSGLSVDLPINGYTSSFNIVKNENELLVNIREVSGSISSSFEYLYNFGVTASLTASINNVTGSTTMSILIPEAGVAETFRYFNPNTTNVAFTASFVATTDSPYTITGSVEYNKGNLSVADINWRALQTSTTQDLEGSGANLNGPTSSFSLRKDIAQKVLIPQVSGAVSVGSYNNENSFNQTASLSQNVNNTTGSVTMSIVVPESGINVTQSWFNPTTTTATLTASFIAETITGSYNVTASVTNNKGNEANSDINWQYTGSDWGNYVDFQNATSSFNIKKDTSYNEVVLVDLENPFTSSYTGSYNNAWAFNQTASLSSSWENYYFTDDSSSRIFGTSQLAIPEIGVSIYTFETSSILTASFAATTDSASYQITASTNLYASQIFDIAIVGGGGGGFSATASICPDTFFIIGGGGGGAGALVTGSFALLANTPYKINIGEGGLVNNNGASSSFVGPVVPFETYDSFIGGIEYDIISVPGGGSGGSNGVYTNNGSNGGSGGGGTGWGANDVRVCVPGAQFTEGGIAVSSSVFDYVSGSIKGLPPTYTGNNGGVGTLTNQINSPNRDAFGIGGPGGGARAAGVAGGVGGAGIVIPWVTINGGSIAGGGGLGVSRDSTTTNQRPIIKPSLGSNGGGAGFRAGGDVNAVQYTGAGGGGCGWNTSPNGTLGAGGSGASGSFTIRYVTPVSASYNGYGEGGVKTIYQNYTVHTFTASGEFTWVQPKPNLSTGSFNIEYLVVAGGGAGGNNLGGGGAGGGYASGSVVVDPQSYKGVYNILIGAGGATNLTLIDGGSQPYQGGGYTGSLSVIQTSSLDYISALGGGGGGGNAGPGPYLLSGSVNGANGGGASYNFPSASGTGSSGFNGGLGWNRDFAAGGGGAGAGQSGSNATSSFSYETFGTEVWAGVAGAGGNGVFSTIAGGTGSYYAGGGGGSQHRPVVFLSDVAPDGGAGGLGGGGMGGSSLGNPDRTPGQYAKPSQAGQQNSGGGGGGAYWGGSITGSAGGSGIVIIKVPTSANMPVTSGAPIITQNGSFNIFTFNSSGQIKFV